VDLVLCLIQVQEANATVGHGLGAVPKMIIIKELNNATNWIVYHAGVGNGGGLQLNTTIATDTDSTFWNSTTPTSSVFSLGSNGNSNGSSDNYIAYCFAEYKASQNLEATQVIKMLMEHLFTQDLNLRLL
jgi:hypothetical protein